MFVNLHSLPAGVHMFTLCVTDQPVGVSEADLFYDEIDVAAPARLDLRDIVKAMSDEDFEAYAGLRVIGAIDQSVGQIIFSNFDSLVTVAR